MIAGLVIRYQALPPERRQFLIHTVLSTIFRVLSAGAAFLLSVVVARTLGTHQAGLFFLALSFASLFGMLSLMGMDNAILRFIGQSNAQGNITLTNQIFTTAYVVVVPVSTTVGVCVFLLSPWLAEHVFEKPDAIDSLRAFAIAIPFISLFLLNGFALQASRRVIASVCSMQFSVTLLLLLALYGLMIFSPAPSASIVAICYSVASIVVVITGLALWFHIPEHAINTQNLRMPTLWKSIPSLWLISITGQAIPWISVVIVGFFCQSQDVAYFSAALRTSLLISFMLMVVSFVAAPRFSALFHADKLHELKQLAQFSTRLMIIFSLPVLIIVLMWPEKIMGLFGSDFISAAPLLMILAIGQTINVMTGSVGFLLIMCGYEKDMRNITVFSGFLTVGLIFPLTHFWGTLGASISVSLGLSVQNLLAMYQVKRRLNFHPFG